MKTRLADVTVEQVLELVMWGAIGVFAAMAAIVLAGFVVLAVKWWWHKSGDRYRWIA